MEALGGAPRGQRGRKLGLKGRVGVYRLEPASVASAPKTGDTKRPKEPQRAPDGGIGAHGGARQRPDYLATRP